MLQHLYMGVATGIIYYRCKHMCTSIYLYIYTHAEIWMCMQATNHTDRQTDSNHWNHISCWPGIHPAIVPNITPKLSPPDPWTFTAMILEQNIHAFIPKYTYMSQGRPALHFPPPHRGLRSPPPPPVGLGWAGFLDGFHRIRCISAK